MSLAVTNQQIEELLETDFDWATLQRGRQYFEQEMVISQSLVKKILSTSVRGSSYKKSYRQVTIFSIFEHEVFVKNYCSCPVGHNCKHMVAALLHYIQHNQKQSSVKPVDPLEQWLDYAKEVISDQQQQTRQNTQPDKECLHYIIEARHSSYHGDQLIVELRKTKWLQSQRWAKGSKIKAQQLSPYTAPDWVKKSDLDIAEMLGESYYEYEIPLNQLGAFILKKMIETGRCYYLDNDSPAISLQKDKKAQFKWDKHKDGRSLSIQLKDCPHWRLIATDPPFYLDTDKQQMGHIIQALPLGVFIKLAELPVLNKEQQAIFSQFTVEQLPVKSLPTPIKLDIQCWQGKAVPVITLFSNKVANNIFNPKMVKQIPLLRLQFEYTPMLLEGLFEHEQQSSKIIEHNKQRWQVQRDAQQENECLQYLFSQQLVDASSSHLGISGQCNLLFPSKNKEHLAARWYQFDQNIEELRKQGWKVIVEDSFNFNFHELAIVEAQVEEQQNGWFELGFNVAIGNRSLPLLPLILQWLEQKNPDMPLLIEADNGKWQKVPKSVIQPVLDTLMELYQDPKLNDKGQLSLPRQQAHHLVSLDDEMNLEWQGGEQIRKLGEKLRHFSGIETLAPPKGLVAKLRPYQQEGLNWLNFLREYGFSGILADDMGLGKTLQSLSFLQHELEAGRLNSPSIIVAPTSVLHNWQIEATKFCPSLSCHIHHGPKRYKTSQDLQSFHIIVTSYALLQRDLVLLKELKPYALILDEAQNIKNAKAKSAQAACELPVQFKLCLTGTPVENHLGEMWALFHFLMPGFLSSEKQFNRLFRTPIEKLGETAPMKNLTKRIAPFILRRNKTEVATELPPKTEMIRTVEMGNEQGKLYETVRLAMEKKVNSLIQKKGANRSHIEMLDALLKLRQICCDPRLLKLESAKNVKQSAKLDMLMTMLEELLEEGRTILLFSQFTGMLALIEAEVKKRKISYSKITGQTQKRQQQVEQFQNGEVPLFLISLKAGGTGLNLTAADTVIHYDPWWNPAAENQATDRAYRIGQDKPVFVYKLVTENSVEEKILELQKRKKALADDLYGNEQQEPMKKIDADELLSLFQ